MTVSATYMPDLSRVRVAFSSAPAAADYALIERSLDGITWSTVRGGAAVPVATGYVDDYEFSTAVVNTYRVSWVDTAVPFVAAAGTVASGNNASITPALPAGLVDQDLLVILASIRNSGTGTVNTPAGWTQIMAYGNIAMLARRYTTGVTAPLVTFAGGVANADTIGRMVSIRNAELFPVAFAQQLNTSQQNIPYPDVVSPIIGLALYLMWKQDDWTSVSPVASWADSVTAGDDAAQAIYPVDMVATTQPGNIITVTGGAAAISRVAVGVFRKADYIIRETTTTTPTITKLWIKNPAKPYLNFQVQVPVGELVITREPRAGVFPVKGRPLPVAVTDLRLGKEFDLGVRLEAQEDRDRMELVLDAGDAIFLHVPAGEIRLKSMYATIGKGKYDDEARTYTLPLTQVAATAPTTAGSTTTWNDVVATYASWDALVAAKATWNDVVDTVGSGTVVVP